MTTLDEGRLTDDEWAVPDEDPTFPEPLDWEPPEGATPEEVARTADEAWFDDATRAYRRARARQDRHDTRVQRMLDQAHVEAAEAEARITEWGIRKGRRGAQYLAFLEEALGRYVLAVRERTGDRVKSLSSPYATVRTREAGGAWKAECEAEVIEWARLACPSAVKVSEKLLVSELKRIPGMRVEDGQVVAPGGVLVPGIVVTPKVLTATVDPEGES